MPHKHSPRGTDHLSFLGSVPKGENSIEVADISSRRSLLQEVTREETKVGDAARKMRVVEAIHGDTGLDANESSDAEIRRTDQVSCEAVDAVFERTSPIKRGLETHGCFLVWRKANRRADIGNVRRSKNGGKARINRIGKERIEGVEIRSGPL